LRIEAGDRPIGSAFDRLRDPTGSPVDRYVSTIERKIARVRSLSVLTALVASVRDFRSCSLDRVARTLEPAPPSSQIRVPDVEKAALQLASGARTGLSWRLYRGDPP
jgi:hypothetical protein